MGFDPRNNGIISHGIISNGIIPIILWDCPMVSWNDIAGIAELTMFFFLDRWDGHYLGFLGHYVIFWDGFLEAKILRETDWRSDMELFFNNIWGWEDNDETSE